MALTVAEWIMAIGIPVAIIACGLVAIAVLLAYVDREPVSENVPSFAEMRDGADSTNQTIIANR